LDDLEIEIGVLDLVPAEVLGGQNTGRAHERDSQDPDDASKHGDLG
jgi:hypothetical protein